MNIKERIQSNKKVTIGLVISVVLLLGLYFLFLHNRVSTTPFRVSQSDMGEEQFYEYVEENGAELSFSLQSPGMLTDEVKEALLNGEGELEDGIYTWVDDEFDETHIVLVGEEGKVSGIYGVHREGDDVLIGWSSEDWETSGANSDTTHIVHLVIDEILDDSNNKIHLVDVDMADEVSDLVTIPTGGDSMTDEELAEAEENLARDQEYAELMTGYFSSEFGVTFDEWQALTDSEQLKKANEAGFESLDALEVYIAENVASQYNINIEDELDQLYQHYFGRTIEEMAELDSEEYLAVIDASAISQEEFQDLVNELIEEKEGGL